MKVLKLTKSPHDQNLPPRHSIRQSSPANSRESGNDGVGQVVTELTRDGSDTEIVVDDGVEVTETVP